MSARNLSRRAPLAVILSAAEGSVGLEVERDDADDAK